MAADQDHRGGAEVRRRREAGARLTASLAKERQLATVHEDGEQELQRKHVDMRALLDEAVAAARKQRPEQRFSVETAPDLPTCLVDAPLMESAVQKLLDNAATYSEVGGEVRVAARLRAADRMV